MKAHFSSLILLKLVAHLPLIASAYPVGLNLEETRNFVEYPGEEEEIGNARRKHILFADYPGEEEETGNARRRRMPFVVYPGEDESPRQD
ncbi:hypothetical protein C8R45DRAFT_1094749 [Mycena sanguinolenta]|nr:hypothetical protein C8R45DRAFT_1094749 [Mycena sanguinolenta]